MDPFETNHVLRIAPQPPRGDQCLPAAPRREIGPWAGMAMLAPGRPSEKFCQPWGIPSTTCKFLVHPPCLSCSRTTWCCWCVGSWRSKLGLSGIHGLLVEDSVCVPICDFLRKYSPMTTWLCHLLCMQGSESFQNCLWVARLALLSWVTFMNVSWAAALGEIRPNLSELVARAKTCEATKDILSTCM